MAVEKHDQKKNYKKADKKKNESASAHNKRTYWKIQKRTLIRRRN